MIRSTATLGMLAAVLFASGCDGGSSTAQSGCSVRSLQGAYIYALDGFSISGDTGSQRTPFAQSGRELFKGDGTMSGVGVGNFNGNVVHVAYTGTYTVAADCSGAVTFTDAAAAVSHYDIALQDDGAAFGFVQTDPNVVTAAFERRRTTSDKPCSQATLKGNYVYAGDGFVIAGGGSTQRMPFATAGREVYGGDGTISGNDTTSTNGVVERTAYTATYTVNADCSATYVYDNDPTNPYALFLDPSGREFAYVATAATRVAAGYERRQ
ncbi:MAG: hypothetical protein ABI629_05925 [bacterium]